MCCRIKPISHSDGFRSASKLAAEIWYEHYNGLISAEQIEYMLDKFQSAAAIQQQVQHDNYHYYVAYIDYNPAAYCAVQPKEGSRLFLSKIYVLKQHRGKGIGKKMIAHAVQELRPPGETILFLTVNKQNSGSIDAYKAWGFHITKCVCTDIGNGYVMDDYVLERTLMPCEQF